MREQLIDQIEQNVASDIIESPHEVRDELGSREDDIAYRWVKPRNKIFLIPGIDQTRLQQLTGEYSTISQKVKKRGEGLSATDASIIAHAKIKGYTVITEERRKRSKAKGNIVYVCQVKNIRCGNFLTYLKDRKFDGKLLDYLEKKD